MSIDPFLIRNFLFPNQADQSGTITEILAEDGKAVSVDMVTFFIFSYSVFSCPCIYILSESTIIFVKLQPLFVIVP